MGQADGDRRAWAPAVAALLVALVALGCARAPLFDMLGYESAAAMALCLGAVSPAIGLSAAAHARSPREALMRAMRPAVGLWALALVGVWARGQWVGPCNDRVGLAFWLLLPLPSALYGSAVGLALGSLPACRRRAAVRLVGCAAVPAAALGLALWRLYDQPPIRAYSHLLGYFAGSLFDEDVAPSAALVAFRGLTLVEACAWGWLACTAERRHGAWRRPAAWLLAVAAGGSALHAALDERLGIRLSRTRLQAEVLPQAIVRGNLVVHVPAGTAPEQAARIGDDHAFRWRQLVAQVPAAARLSVHSYVFASARDKGRALGGVNTQVARPWRREIYLHGLEAPHPLLAHELAHVALGAVAPGPLHVAAAWGVWPNMPMVEGLAVALAPDTTSLGLMETARHLQDLGLGAKLTALLDDAPWAATRAFWAESPERVYAQAGALFVWLRQQYGLPAVLRAYAEGRLGGAFAADAASLERDFRAALGARPADAGRQRQIRGEMRRESVFRRRCPHEAAALAGAWARCAGPGGPTCLPIAESLCEATAGGLDARLARWAALRARAPKEPYAARARAEEAALLALDTDPLGRARVLDAACDAAAERQDWPAAERANAAARRLPVDEALSRRFAARAIALAATVPVRQALLRMLAGDGDADAWGRARALAGREGSAPERALAAYLAARREAARGREAAAADALAALPPLPDPLLERERWRLLVVLRWRLQALGQAAEALDRWRLLGRSPRDRAWADDWRARLADAEGAPTR